jgi:1-acyl-sn-glycerol-3-phosphate acyltransferase
VQIENDCQAGKKTATLCHFTTRKRYHSAGREESIKLLNLRGLLAMMVIGVFFLGGDLVERTLIVAIIKLKPSVRERVLYSWVKGIADFAFWVIRHIGGAKFEIDANVPWDPGVLVVMNHQSLLDIPIAVKSVVGGYPKIIARDRYRTGIPLVSHHIRLYGHPTVRPGDGGKREITKLRKLAETAKRPVVIYPEGSRSRDGEIRPFRQAGLKAMLAVRSWKVYIIVLDGLWRSTSLGGFIKNVDSLDVRVESVGPFDFDVSTDDAGRFVEELERHMRAKLDEMRVGTSAHLAH